MPSHAEPAGAHLDDVQVKPPTSRPASAERYVLCRGLRGDRAENEALFSVLLAENARIGRNVDGMPTPDHSLVSAVQMEEASFSKFVTAANDRWEPRGLWLPRSMSTSHVVRCHPLQTGASPN